MRLYSLLASAMLSMKSRMYVLGLAVLLVHALGSSRLIHAVSDQKRKEIRDAQVLETPETVFVFVQVSDVVEHTGLLSALASRHPTRRIASQSLITIDGKGNRSETSIVRLEDEKEPDLECNMSHVFVFKGNVFVMQFQHRPILYKWQNDRFVHVPDENAGDLAKTMSSLQKAELRADSHRILDEFTKDSGWRYVDEEADATYRVNYQCNKHNLIIKPKFDDRRFTLPFVKSIVAESLSTTNPWTKTLIEIDPRKKSVVPEKAEEKE